MGENTIRRVRCLHRDSQSSPTLGELEGAPNFSPMHPLTIFHFCPKCGSKAFEINDGRSKRCAKCGFTYYQNTAASTVAVIVDAEGRLVCVRRAKEPAKGTLDLPGGFAEFDESLEEGLLREVKEEIGAEVEIEKYLFSIPNTYRFSAFEVKTLDAFFLCRILPHSIEDLRAADDAAEVLFIPFDELDAKGFGLTSISEGVRRIKELFLSSRHS